MFNIAAKSTLRITLMMTVLSSVAIAQTQTPPAPAPAQDTTKPKAPDESEAVRIRGLVETADANGVVVQLSQGITIRVDILSQAPVYAAARLALTDIKVGESVGVRTRAPQTAGEAVAATEVIVMPDEDTLSPIGMSVTGAFKSLDKDGERAILVVTDGSAERRVTLTNETSVWRLRRASVSDVKPGVSISVLVGRNDAGVAETQRIVFGSPPAGAILPL
ncbi:MAG: hypothetical protein Q8M31_23370 [Beijerinckiaceae bacterium]|nr:hypothetical protein [Beijerinckiaceae bacterium]